MARDHDRVREDVAGIGPDPSLANRLHRLSESHHYRVASGEPDIRGWEVRTLTGTHLGQVEDLLIDPHRGEVVMLDVDINNSTDRVNLPIRTVQIDRDRRAVLVDSADMRAAQDALKHPELHHDAEHRGHDVHLERDETMDARIDDVRDRAVVEEVVVRRRVIDDPDVVEDR